MEKNIIKISDRDLLESIYTKMVSLSETIEFFPDWISIADTARNNDLSYRQMYNRVVESGNYQLHKHYKHMDGEIYIHKSINHTLQRKRRRVA